MSQVPPKALPEGATLVDVRTPAEYAAGHIEGSLSIPLDSVPQALERFRSFQGPVVLICQSGNRSGHATAWLQAQGLTNVENGGSWLSYRPDPV